MVIIKNWTEEQICTLRRMVAQGATSKQISEAIGKKPAAVRKVIGKRKDDLELTLPPIRGRNPTPRPTTTDFEKQWYGSVPYLHWSITKPWKASETL